MTLLHRFSIRRAGAALAVAIAALSPSIARADDDADKAICADAYAKAQDDKDHGHFSSAREQIKICVKSSCKDWMVADCTRWQDEVERRQPTVVLTAETSTGGSVTIAKVSDATGRIAVDGALKGLSLPVDPGSYDVTFTAVDGRVVTVNKLVVEGQKDVVVKAVFVDVARAPIDAKSPIDTAPPTATSARPIYGWSAVGLGAVAIGVGAYFYASGESDKTSAGCAVTCPGTASLYNSGNSKAHLGFGVLVGGGVLAAGGVVLLLTSPSTAHAERAEIRVGASGLGLHVSF